VFYNLRVSECVCVCVRACVRVLTVMNYRNTYTGLTADVTSLFM